MMEPTPTKKEEELKHLIFTAYPENPTKIRSLFSTDGGGAVKTAWELLKAEPKLRPNGWDVHMSEQHLRIVGGEKLVGNLDYRTIEVYEDGSLLAKASAGREFLAWADRHEYPGLIRMTALPIIEFSYNFADFCAGVARLMEPAPAVLVFRVDGVNLLVGEKSCLIPHKTESAYFSIHHRGTPAGKNDFTFDNIRVPLERDSEGGISDADPFDVSAAAFLLVEKIFAFFGFANEKIPYTTRGEDGVMRINPEEIKKAR